MTRFYNTLYFSPKDARLDRLKQQRISHQTNATAISFKRISDANITSYHAKVFSTGTLHAKVIKIHDKHDPLLRYALFFSKHF